MWSQMEQLYESLIIWRKASYLCSHIASFSFVCSTVSSWKAVAIRSVCIGIDVWTANVEYQMKKEISHQRKFVIMGKCKRIMVQWENLKFQFQNLQKSEKRDILYQMYILVFWMKVSCSSFSLLCWPYIPKDKPIWISQAWFLGVF